jgi:hypothetical protein
MPIDQVRSDALARVRSAREAWRTRDPEGAAEELGRIIEPGREPAERTQRILAATGDYLRTQKGKRQVNRDPDRCNRSMSNGELS